MLRFVFAVVVVVVVVVEATRKTCCRPVNVMAALREGFKRG